MAAYLEYMRQHTFFDAAECDGMRAMALAREADESVVPTELAAHDAEHVAAAAE